MLRTLHQGDHIPHAQYPLGHTVWMEYIQILHLFSRRDKLDRLIHHVTDGNGSTPSGITIQLGQHYAIKIESIVKGLCSIHRILTRHGIHYKKCFRWIERFLELLNLLHHRIIHRQTTCSINYYGLFAGFLGICNRIACDLKCIFIFWLSIDLHSDLLTQNLELVNRRRSVNITSNKQHLTSLTLQQTPKLARKGSFTRSL